MSLIKRRICHLVENLERGGLERMVVDLAIEQSAKGHDVDVVCLFGEGALAGELRASGIQVTASRKRRGLDLSAVRRIATHLRSRRVSVLHTHNATANYLGALAALAAPAVVIVNTRHGMGDARHGLRRERLYRCSMLRTFAVALVCEASRRSFVANKIIPERKAQVVPNGIRLSNIDPSTPEKRSAALGKLGLPPESLYVGTVGRLNPVKDQGTLLRSIAIARQSCQNIFLLVVGGGALMGPLVEQARACGVSDRVLFLGDRSNVPEILPAIDIFALSSLTEGYSMSLLEACASALPIIATNVGGNREIVGTSGAGLMVPAGDPVAMSKAIVELGNDAALRLSMGNAGRQWVERHGTLSVMAERYDRLYTRGSREVA